ncbi:MAG: hypothetical protein RL376_303 [Verrucomicrobiota bacterium]
MEVMVEFADNEAPQVSLRSGQYEFSTSRASAAPTVSRRLSGMSRYVKTCPYELCLRVALRPKHPSGSSRRIFRVRWRKVRHCTAGYESTAQRPLAASAASGSMGYLPSNLLSAPLAASLALLAPSVPPSSKAPPTCLAASAAATPSWASTRFKTCAAT